MEGHRRYTHARVQAEIGLVSIFKFTLEINCQFEKISLLQDKVNKQCWSTDFIKKTRFKQKSVE